jgi:transcriptional regulator with XRE-family HTH domain
VSGPIGQQQLDNCYPTGTIVYTTASRVSIPQVWTRSAGPILEPDNEGIAGIPRRLFAARSLLRARRGVAVTQGMVAEIVGVTEGQVGHWERGRQLPDLPMLELLAAALEVSPVWLSYGVVPSGSSGPRRLSDEEIAEARARVAARRGAESTTGKRPTAPPPIVPAPPTDPVDRPGDHPVDLPARAAGGAKHGRRKRPPGRR